MSLVDDHAIRQPQHSVFDTSNLRLSYVLRFADGLITTTVAFSVPLMIFHITHNIAWSGAAFMLEWLPRLSAIPIAGSLVDRIGSLRFFIITNGLRAVIIAAAALWLHYNPRSWPVLIVLSILTGLLAESAFVAAEKLSVEVVGTQPLQRVQAMTVGIDQTVQVLAPVVGGLLLLFDYDIALSSMLVLSAAGVYLADRLRRRTNSTDSDISREIVETGLLVGIRILRERPVLLYIIFGAALFNLLMALLLTITPAVVEQQFDRETADVSVAWVSASIASVLILGVAVRAAKRFGVSTVGFVAAMTGCVACLGVALAPGYWMYVVCLTVFVAADSCYAIFVRTARAHLVPPAVFGSAVAIIVMLSLVAYPIAGALVAIVPLHSISTLIIVFSLFSAAAICWTFAVINQRVVATPG